MSRLFVAVFPPREAAEALRFALPLSARLTPLAKWHVTLVFLGDVDDWRVPDISEILRDIGADPFRLRFAGGGRFGKAAWSALGGDTTQLATFRTSVRDALTAAGFPSDDRPFTPHLTVTYAATTQIDAALATFTGAPWDVTSFALLSSQADRYERLHEWPLTATA